MGNVSNTDYPVLWQVKHSWSLPPTPPSPIPLLIWGYFKTWAARFRYPIGVPIGVPLHCSICMDNVKISF